MRSEGASDPHSVEYLRGVVSGGLLVVAAPLAPLALSRFGLEGRALWVTCSVFFFVAFLVFWAADARSSENRFERQMNRGKTVRYAAIALPMTVCLLGSLLLIIIGAWPQHAAALYFLAVTLWLVETGFTLFWLVWTPDSAKLPAS